MDKFNEPGFDPTLPDDDLLEPGYVYPADFPGYCDTLVQTAKHGKKKARKRAINLLAFMASLFEAEYTKTANALSAANAGKVAPSHLDTGVGVAGVDLKSNNENIAPQEDVSQGDGI